MRSFSTYSVTWTDSQSMWAARKNIPFYSLLPFKCCCSCCSCMQVSLSLSLCLYSTTLWAPDMRVTQSRLFPFFSFLIFGKYTKRNRLLLLVEVIIISLPTLVMSMAVENSIRLTYKVIRCIHSSLRVCVCVVRLPSSFLFAAIGNCKKFHLRCAVVYCAAHWATFDDMSCVTPVTNVCVFWSFFFFWWRPLWLFLI